MSDGDVEEMLRDVFRQRDAAAGSGRTDLLAGARARAATSRHRTLVGAAVAAVVVTGGVTAAVAIPFSAGPVAPSIQPADPPAAAGQTPDLVHDWVWFSSRGLQIAIPGGWEVNDYGCPMSDRPSAVRGVRLKANCKPTEWPHKQLAIITDSPDRSYAGLSRRELTVSGQPASLAEGRLPDGRYAAELSFPALGVYLQVRTRDEPERREIIRSAHLVDVDHLGCDTQRPPIVRPVPVPDVLLPPDPARSARVCYYGQDTNGRLVASVELDNAATTAIVAAVNAAPPGTNPSPPFAFCLPEVEPLTPDLVVRLAEPGAPANEADRLWLRYSGCTGRGMDNGATRSEVSQAIVDDLMRGLKIEYHPMIDPRTA